MVRYEGFEIKHHRDHYVILKNGKWYGEAMTISEAMADIKDELKEEQEEQEKGSDEENSDPYFLLTKGEHYERKH